jgi:DNA-binding NarL/FixJ family response regulator
MAAMKVALVDDRQVMRAGIRQLLASYTDIQVLEIADRFPAALDRIFSLGPEVVILGEVDDSQDPTRVIGQLRTSRRSAGCRVLLMRDVKTQSEAVRIMAAGAHGYVPSYADARQLASALVIVGGGGQALLPGLVASISPTAGITESAPDTAGLTKRELSVLSALGRGLSNSEIAVELAVSEATVKKHLSSVMRKVGQRDRLRAGLYAYRYGVGLS